MGLARQAAEGVIAAFEGHKPQQVKQWLAADFVFVDPNAPQPLGADEWVGVNQNMQAAFPDLSYNFEILEEKGNQVWVRNNFEGTHKADWDLSRMGLGVVPATGKSVSSGSAVTVGTVNDDGKVTRIEIVEAEPGSGAAGVMEQLGINMG